MRKHVPPLPHGARDIDAATRKSPLPVRVSRGHGYSGCRLVALRQENQPHELQHRSHEVDDDSSKKTTKTNSTPQCYRFAANRHDPDAKEWEEQHLVHPFEFGWGEAARCLEVEDRERNLAG
jgi:hypothetical protein